MKRTPNPDSQAAIAEVGEAKLVQRIRGFQDLKSEIPFVLDDAAPVWTKGFAGRLLVTTDPAPFPCLVHRLGMGTAYHTGWLVVVKSLSDLAAAGARPIGVTIAAEFCPSTTLAEFDEFFSGAVDCAVEHGTRLVGGNIKEVSDRKHAVAFAIGARADDYSLSRRPAQPGDQVLLVDGNDWAAFWAGIAAHKRIAQGKALPSEILDYVSRRALKPRAQITAGNVLAESRATQFVMDTSDGLLATTLQLARRSESAVHLELSESALVEPVLSVARTLKADPRIWALGWGSCELLFTCKRNEVDRISGSLRERKIKCLKIGEVRRGSPHVFVREGSQTHRMSESPFLRGEQFHKESIWNRGIEKYIDIMLTYSLSDIMTRKRREGL
jgi:thiamine-monophosphate kinase